MIGSRLIEISSVLVAMLGFFLELARVGSMVPRLRVQNMPVDESVIHGPFAGPRAQRLCTVCKGFNRSYLENAVLIEFEGKGNGFRIRGISQGTLLAGNRLLTHHHYDPALELLESLTLTLTNAGGRQVQVSVDPRRIVIFDAATAIIPLPDDVNIGTGVASLNPVELSLEAEEMVTVIYLNDAHELAQTRFAVLTYTREPGGLPSLIVEDPRHLIEPGDSGGGVYADGMLIGNLWAIGPAPDGSQYVRVGLVPAGVWRNDGKRGWLAPNHVRRGRPLFARGLFLRSAEPTRVHYGSRSVACGAVARSYSERMAYPERAGTRRGTDRSPVLCVTARGRCPGQWLQN